MSEKNELIDQIKYNKTVCKMTKGVRLAIIIYIFKIYISYST